MKNKEIFKVGDTVYHYDHGEGKVMSIYKNNPYPVIVRFNRGEDSFTKDGRQLISHPTTLSFTPYDLINGGFSQEKPLPDIEVDTLVYVRDSLSTEWKMRYFSHFGEDGKIRCFNDQKKSKDSAPTAMWYEWSLTNPLEEK